MEATGEAGAGAGGGWERQLAVEVRQRDAFIGSLGDAIH